MDDLFDEGGLWVKAALHCHSKGSDGSLSPRGVVEFYKDRGYEVVSITDHNVVTLLKDDIEGVLTIPGVELSVGRSKCGSSYHIVVLGLEEISKPKVNNIEELNSFLAEVEDEGGVAFVAHPYWSNLFSEDLYELNNYVGIEVYNTGCDVEVAKGFSSVHWDQVISLGRTVWGIAVDDAHRYLFPPLDAGYGWVWIKLKELKEEEFLGAIRRGAFYSSMGPQVFKFHFKDSSLHIEMSPVIRVNIVSENGRGFSLSTMMLRRVVESWRKGGDDIKRIIDDIRVEHVNDETRLVIAKGERSLNALLRGDSIISVTLNGFKFSTYLRVEIVDSYGRYAWLNPLLLC